jgi:hypothetical protein
MILQNFLVVFSTMVALLAPRKTYGTPCIPLEGRTAIVVGQDYYSILNYTSTFGENPFGVMSYTALRSTTGNLAGLAKPVDYGSGIEWAQGLVKKYNSSSLQLGLWLVGQVEDVAEGLLNREITRLGTYLSSIAPTPVYLRIGYEFDSEENSYDVDSYIEAFQTIVNSFRAMGVTNVAFVWHSSGQAPRDGLQSSAWYPGDAFVDWCGVSIFLQPYDCQIADKCPMPFADDLATFCKARGKPVMVAESTPYGGIVQSSGDQSNEAGYKGASWSRWFVPVLAFINKHDVRMWCYINCNWDSLPMWQIKHAPGEMWGDSRIEGEFSVSASL